MKGRTVRRHRKGRTDKTGQAGRQKGHTVVATLIMPRYVQKKLYISYLIRKGDFWGFFCFFMYDIQHCFICRPSNSTVSEDAVIERRIVATLALTARRSNQSAISYPQLGQISYSLGQISSTSRLYCIHKSARFHTNSARSHPHWTRSHPHSARSHPHLAYISSTYLLALIHNSARSHPHISQLSSTHVQISSTLGQISSTLMQISSTSQLDLIHTRLDLIHTRLDFIHTRIDLIHISARSHPHQARSHPHSARSHPHSARSHPDSDRSRPHLGQISSTSRLDLIHRLNYTRYRH